MEDEELIPKKYYVELLKQFIDLSVENQIAYLKGLITGLIVGFGLSYLIYVIWMND